MNYTKKWFKSLNKPPFQPPSKIFAPVWTVLYILMFLGFLFVLNTPVSFKWVLAIGLFIFQLYVNLMWPIAFFVEHNLSKAFLIAALLNFLVFLTTLIFFKLSTIAGLIFLPYLLWCCFATILSFEILERNE